MPKEMRPLAFAQPLPREKDVAVFPRKEGFPAREWKAGEAKE